jgi:hypothetical protein
MVNYEVTIIFPLKVFRNIDSIKHTYYFEKGINYERLAEIGLTTHEFDNSTEQIEKTYFINKKLNILSDTARIYLQSDYYRKDKSFHAPKLEVSKIVKEIKQF